MATEARLGADVGGKNKVSVAGKQRQVPPAQGKKIYTNFTLKIKDIASSKNQSVKQSTRRKIPKIQSSSTARVIIQEDITDVSCSAQTNLHGAEAHRFIHQNQTATIQGVSGFRSVSAG